MAKRFYNTEKYKDLWYRKLSADLKCVFDYCLCVCDHAGILALDIETINYMVKPSKKISLEEIINNFGDKFAFLDEYTVFIPRFLYWQYKNELIPTNKVHRSVYDRLKEFQIDVTPFLAPFVKQEDFEDWLGVYRELKENNKKYEDILKERKPA